MASFEILLIYEPSYIDQLLTGFIAWFYIDARCYLKLVSRR